MKTLILTGILFFAGMEIHAQKPAVVITQKSGWTKIGDVKADFKLESESIVIMGNDKFKALKFKAKDAPINILAIQIFYESGKIDNISLRAELQMNEETDPIEVEEKSLSKVLFIYKTLPNPEKDKAELELYGLK